MQRTVIARIKRMPGPMTFVETRQLPDLVLLPPLEPEDLPVLPPLVPEGDEINANAFWNWLDAVLPVAWAAGVTVKF